MRKISFTKNLNSITNQTHTIFMDDMNAKKGREFGHKNIMDKRINTQYQMIKETNKETWMATKANILIL